MKCFNIFNTTLLANVILKHINLWHINLLIDFNMIIIIQLIDYNMTDNNDKKKMSREDE